MAVDSFSEQMNRKNRVLLTLYHPKVSNADYVAEGTTICKSLSDSMGEDSEVSDGHGCSNLHLLVNSEATEVKGISSKVFGIRTQNRISPCRTQCKIFGSWTMQHLEMFFFVM